MVTLENTQGTNYTREQKRRVIQRLEPPRLNEMSKQMGTEGRTQGVWK